MTNYDFFSGTILLNLMNNFQKYSLKKTVYTFLLYIFLSQINKLDIFSIYRQIKDILESYQLKSKITFVSKKRINSEKYRAIMHYISKNPHSDIRELQEVNFNRYNYKKEENEDKDFYRVDQYNKFKIDKYVYGNMEIIEKKTDQNGHSNYEENIYFYISSNKLTLIELETWIDSRQIEFNNYLKNKCIDKQYLIECFWDDKNDTIITDYNTWESNCKFENKFFDQKEEVLKKVKFFLNNKKWYEEKGIPYTLGILLYGEPGCGKTSFIKSLMNYTQRHGLDIKLQSNFDFKQLKDMIMSDKINDTLIIPQNKRILIFEDIDAMSDIVKDRKLKEDNNWIKPKKDELPKNKDDIKIEVLKEFLGNSQEKKESKNNLSYLLNILDGIHESNGRIIIMTTNKPEVLDKALIRPGRIDIKINFKKASPQNIKDIIENFFGKTKNLDLKKLKNISVPHCLVSSICRISQGSDDAISNLLNHSPNNFFT